MKPSTGDGAETRAHFTRLPGLADPVLQFDLAKEIEQLRTKESWGRENWTEFRHPGCQQEGC